VIERPASVVKELVENSLDAQAARVTVEIQAGGRSLIRVIDDGLGMSRDDALLCLERHATSKIQRAEDLAAIATMGFRGEALPSIASVSRFTLTTRERESESPEGTQVIISGGRIIEVKAAGTAPGTTVEVRQLFFNLPARRKFLRTEETEAAHVQHYLTLAALAFPEVAFAFQRDGRPIWQLAPVRTGTDIPARIGALRERLRALYGDERKLLPVNLSADLPSWQEPEDLNRMPAPPVLLRSPPTRPADFRLWGFLGAPGVSRATREDQHLFVNRRPIENRGLNFALLEGYHTALMKGRYPVCCLFVEIDPGAVDVNIHPAKREVKFRHEPEVRRLVAQAVRQTLVAFHSPQPTTDSLKPKLQTGQTEQTSLPNFPVGWRAPAEPSAPPAAQPPLAMGFAPAPAAPTPARPADTVPPAAAALCPAPPGAPAAPETVRPAEQTPRTTHRAPGTTLPPRPSAAPESSPPPQAVEPLSPRATVPLLNVPLRLIGVVSKLYVVLESDRGLVLLDQHAAHERILFEQMLNRLEQKDQAPSQKLLLPETVELSARDASFVREQLPVLTRLGVGLSEFGERTFLLDALPPFVKTADPRQFVLELVDGLKAVGREVNSSRLGEQTVAKTVCRHAVKAHDPLAGRELENLIADLRLCAMPYTCPHGRPTLIEMNFRELEKKFGRSQ
jgi:DNA mismatch repair protein MutL